MITYDVFCTENYDHVTVYDGTSSSTVSPYPVASGCAVIPTPIYATGSELYIEFATDYTIAQSGFSATVSCFAGNPCLICHSSQVIFYLVTIKCILS